MCNFVPGECLAVLSLEEAERKLARIEKRHFPGILEIVPLLPEPVRPGSNKAADLSRYAFIHVTGIPDGLEVLVVALLSSVLSDLILAQEAVVELNYYLPLAAQAAQRRQDQFSPSARQIIDTLRRFAERQTSNIDAIGSLAVLDSGINRSNLQRGRNIAAYDYTGPRWRFGDAVEGDHDLQGHGTAVAQILDAGLPPGVQLVSGRVAAGSVFGITVLRVALAFAHLIAISGAAVVNLSLAPRDDEVICPNCRRSVPVEAFHSLILPFVFRLADGSTAVMAAGNRGQLSNGRHALAGAGNLVLVEATNSRGQVAGYSNRVNSAYATVVRIFGGDDPVQEGAVAVFENAPKTYGTSFAAPFVAAIVFAYLMTGGGRVTRPEPRGFVTFCKREFDLAVSVHTPEQAAERILVPA